MVMVMDSVHPDLVIVAVKKAEFHQWAICVGLDAYPLGILHPPAHLATGETFFQVGFEVGVYAEAE